MKPMGFLLAAAAGVLAAAPTANGLRIAAPPTWIAHPLDAVTVVGSPGTAVQVKDGVGRVYLHLPAAPKITFSAGGALGKQTVESLDASGKVLDSATFTLEAASSVDDNGGPFSDLFRITAKTMRGEHKDGVGEITYKDRVYHYFEPWILDHSHNAKGMQYLSPYTREMVDLFGAAQRPDGMIWSFAFPDHSPEHQYHYWAYKDQGYAFAEGGVLFARQPVENHNEANFVDTLYLAWKAEGDDTWMTSHLEQAKKALDYSITDKARWSEKDQLLKRGYTIDSWDFQPNDKYLVPFRMGDRQQIDPERTKFVIFFGDNTAYAHACDQLAEMLARAGKADEARAYRERGATIRKRLDALAWNGKYYVHHVEEDSTVVRDLGVDEKTQLAMSNLYSLNRGITDAQAVSILETYQNLRAHLPNRSPGEWYSAYPPYEKGFGSDNGRWQYMNAGVHAHAAGEAARGAFEHGFEAYGADTLVRLRDLANRTGGKLAFAYTGAWDPAPPTPAFVPVDLSRYANMDIAGESKDGVPAWMFRTDGNDMRNLPTGEQTFAGIPFKIADPGTNGRRVAIGVSAANQGLPPRAVLPLGKTAKALYLLHASDSVGASNVAAALRFEYADGSSRTQYLVKGRHLSNSWFPALAGPDAGVAWRGANGACGDVGIFWSAIANPDPDKTIARLVFLASEEGATYGLVGLTLADRLPYREAPAVSFGGPDNWSAALVMDALMEGLAGVRDDDTAYRIVRLSPRWTAGNTSEVVVTARYAASNGYVHYRFEHDPASRKIGLQATGNAEKCRLRILLPPGAQAVEQAAIDKQPATPAVERVHESAYAVFDVSLASPVSVELRYR
jgi:hypothetical protein